MRLILSLSALALGVGASAAPPQAAPALDSSPAPPSVRVVPNAPENSSALKGSTPANCRGRIEGARAERGLSKLERDTANPDPPMFIAAVDKLIGGCEVLVMRDNLSDIRPLPEFREGPGKLTPLKAQ